LKKKKVGIEVEPVKEEGDSSDSIDDHLTKQSPVHSSVSRLSK